ncbi:UBP-type zinc finger domain-containing protein [Kibdelosporangium aridum]|uniref:UBP-type zinc finger domain-containing protein n=1 Tax=Kibdelosporangium aridum TaxID=2030 RepID=UPI0035E4E34A
MTPHTTDCPQCIDPEGNWVELSLCLSCGWVACSANSPHHHAKDHYEETDHPITATPAHNPDNRWCYVHQRAV